MIIFIAALIGAITGAFVARRRKGRAADIAQYSVVFAMIATVIAVIVLVIIARVTA